ncbi:MAG: 3-deoxy-manno-octulosonate cytidylyltransferase [Gammaproteobacteria bacterium]
MIQHVYERAMASGAEEVIVATDDERVVKTVEGFGGQVCLTRREHLSGTDRIEEVAASQGWADETIIVNLQGDEPTMPPPLLDQVAQLLEDHPEAAIATLCVPIDRVEELFDPNVVKVVRDRAGRALLFSRAPIPWDRDTLAKDPPQLSATVGALRHIGLYAYRAAFLHRYVSWEPCPLERAESLEQLRALWHGETVFVEAACVAPGHGVDTEADLAAAEAALRRSDPGREGFRV